MGKLSKNNQAENHQYEEHEQPEKGEAEKRQCLFLFSFHIHERRFSQDERAGNRRRKDEKQEKSDWGENFIVGGVAEKSFGAAHKKRHESDIRRLSQGAQESEFGQLFLHRLFCDYILFSDS